MIEQVKRTLTAVVYTKQAELLVLNKNDFLVVQKALEQSLLDKKNLVFSIFEVTEYSKVRLESMLYSFRSEEIKKKKKVCVEDEQGEKFYIIQQGEVIILKNNIPISILGRGSIFGEEIVQEKYYEYTVLVKSLTATIMAISYIHFHSKFP